MLTEYEQEYFKNVPIQLKRIADSLEKLVAIMLAEDYKKQNKS